ncbi:NlpC/P60 family protein [Acinetobacter oleivorans]|uniref:hypothetical protein n=1 Tax=Acinetobacter oleivorans TaxID=1148157 RepID=UPI001785469D|nr:hypothetical protein [Acinetobacter oleivorans]
MEYGITDRKIGDNLTGIAAVNEALTWLGTPYHPQGRIKGVGVDCGTLSCEVYEKVGLMDHLDPRPYPPDWHIHQMGQRYLELILGVCDPVEGLPQPGDIVLYHFGKCISHGAIVIEWPQVIHSYIHQGVIIQDGTKGSLARPIAGFFRMKRLKK